MLTDTKVIHRSARFDVLGQRFEVQFKDGLAVWLHMVRRDGVVDKFARALVDRGEPVRVFDLTRAAPELDLEIRHARAHDVPGLVFYTLRARYLCAQDFRRQVKAVEMESWSVGRPTSTAVQYVQCTGDADVFPADWATRRFWPITARG